MRKLIRMLSCTAMMLLFSTLAFASVNDDQVTSQKIKEADGTSGQNTNSGSGVKTGHIQDGAVTTSKIAVSAVTSSVIANGAVTNAKIADGAVTDAKITGPISAAKISSTGLNADTVDGKHAADLAPAVHAHPTSQVTGLDAALAGKAEVLHNHDNLYQQKYGRVAVVAQTGGDYTSPYDAAINYMDWCPTPYAGNPCLIKVMPGVYDIGATAVYLPPYLDLEGSGENVTVIKGAGVSPPGVGDLNVYQVISGDGATGVNEVRSLTVENYGTVNAPTSTGIANISAISNVRVTVAVQSGNAYGVYSSGMPYLKMTNVKVTASAFGANALSMSGGAAVLNHVSLQATSSSATNGIILGAGAAVTINDSDIQSTGGVSYGVQLYPGTARLTNTTITAGTYGIMTVQSTSNAYVDHSSISGGTRYIAQIGGNVYVTYAKVDGGRTSGGYGLPKCIGVYNNSYDLYADSTCGLAP